MPVIKCTVNYTTCVVGLAMTFTATYHGSTQGAREMHESMITGYKAERIWKGNVIGGEVCERQLFTAVDKQTQSI